MVQTPMHSHWAHFGGCINFKWHYSQNYGGRLIYLPKALAINIFGCCENRFSHSLISMDVDKIGFPSWILPCTCLLMICKVLHFECQFSDYIHMQQPRLDLAPQTMSFIWHIEKKVGYGLNATMFRCYNTIPTWYELECIKIESSFDLETWWKMKNVIAYVSCSNNKKGSILWKINMGHYLENLSFQVILIW